MTFHKSEILYVRVDIDIKERIQKLAEINDRSQASMVNILLRKGLGLPDKKITFILEEDI